MNIVCVACLWLQSEVTSSYNRFFWALVILCGAVATGIAAALIYFVWRYRRRDPNEFPSQIALKVPAEVAWIGLPFLIFMGMFYYGAKLYFRIERPPDNAEDVYVVAKQWMWKMQHVDGEREINELHVPVGQAIRLNMISQDVIHSFYVPAFRIKQDVLPDRYTVIWFKAVRAGKYRLNCAEYCGTNHSQMGGWIYAMDPKDYRAWLERGGAEGSLASTGEKLFHQFACSNCHRYAGHGRAPNLVGLYGTPVRLAGGQLAVADDTYIRESILKPNAQIAEGFQSSIMPTFQGQLTEDDVIALIAYIKALGAGPAKNAQGEPDFSTTPTIAPVESGGPNSADTGVH